MVFTIVIIEQYVTFYCNFCMCSEMFLPLRYRSEQNQIVADYLIGQLVEKYPLKQVISKTSCFVPCIPTQENERIRLKLRPRGGGLINRRPRYLLTMEGDRLTMLVGRLGRIPS